MTTIERIVFLIHPGCYQTLPADSPLQESNLGVFVERERVAQQRWMADLAASDRRTLFLQLYGPEPLFEAARKLLGDANACYSGRLERRHIRLGGRHHR